MYKSHLKAISMKDDNGMALSWEDMPLTPWG